MPDNALSERVGRIEQKLDAVSAEVSAKFAHVDERFAQVDERFEKLREELDERFREVQEHVVEQREYVEFAYERLDRRMSDGFSRLEQKIDRIILAQRPRAATTRRRSRPAKRRR